MSELLDLVRTLLPETDVDADTELFASGRLDSMRVLDLISFVEANIGRTLSDDELIMANFRTPRTIEEVFLR